jgi:hypothetical protein
MTTSNVLATIGTTTDGSYELVSDSIGMDV